LVGAEQDLVAAKHSDTRLGFVLLLKFHGRRRILRFNAESRAE